MRGRWKAALGVGLTMGVGACATPGKATPPRAAELAAALGSPYFAQVVQFDRLPKGADGAVPRTLRTADLRRPGGHAGVRSPVSPAFGWWPDPARTAGEGR